MEEINSINHPLPSPNNLFVLSPGSIFPGYKCEHCDLVFFSDNNRKLHNFSVQEITHVQAPESILENPEFICSICKTQLNSYKGLKQHHGKQHSDIKTEKCSICNKKYRHKYALKFHVEQVHKKSTLVGCIFCSRQFYNKYRLKKHLALCCPDNERNLESTFYIEQ